MISRAEYLMGTVCEITVDASGERELDAAFAEGRRVEGVISTWREESEFTRLNRGGDLVVSAETYDLLGRAVELSRSTQGAFNPLMRGLIDSWKTRSEGANPPSTQIDRARQQASLQNISFGEGGRITLRDGARIEEGAFGKGYAIDRMLRRIPAEHAVINFGGQLFVRGETEVLIANPEQRDVAVISLRIRDASLSTSSGSEKTFVIGGRRFTHIIDPRTGDALPPRGSASVIALDAFSADALSTALYVMGPADGLRWANANNVAALFITPDHHIRASTAFRELASDVVILDDHFIAKD